MTQDGSGPCDYCGDPITDHTPSELKSCATDVRMRTVTFKDVTGGEPVWLLDLNQDDLIGIMQDENEPDSRRRAARRELTRRSTEPLRMAATVGADKLIATMAARGMVVLDEDGHPMDVRLALRMAGLMALHRAEIDDYDVYELLGDFGIHPPLSGACIELAERT